MEIDIIEVKEQLRDVRRFAERKQEELQEQINMQKAAMNLLELFDRVLHENERLKSELEQQQTENDDLHQQLENLRQQLGERDMKIKEMSNLSTNVAKKSSQEALEKAIRIYINTSKRKTQAKREVAKAQLQDFIVTAKLEMPDDIMESLDHLDDEQPESAQTTSVVVQAGGINVQQANTVAK